MKYFTLVLVVLVTFTFVQTDSYAFAPKNRSFGIGLMAGEPSGLTAKFWLQRDRALDITLGNSYMGNLRIGADYLWHFNAFNTSVVNLFSGIGAAVGIGESGGWLYHDHDRYWYKHNDELGIGIRALAGINIVPRNSPIEIFLDLALMMGIQPAFHTNTEGAFGIRFYF